jgi:DNA-directed RNA polymerase subunit E'/Rpb7
MHLMKILIGKIVSSNKDGISVSLGFFDDVFVPSYLLQAPSEFKPDTSLWVWKYGEDEQSEFVMDIGEEVCNVLASLSTARFTFASLILLLMDGDR